MVNMAWRSLALVVSAALSCAAQTLVVVNGTASHPIPTTLFGQMFEDINHSGDGGLYGELIQNRAFQQVTPGTAAALSPWTAVGDAQIAVVASSEPVSSALPNSLQVVVPSDASAPVGFANPGYAGINVNASWTYNASFYVRVTTPPTSSSSINLTASLVSSTGSTLGSISTSVLSSQTEWTQVALQMTPSASGPDDNNNFTVSTDASGAGATLEFALISLFPPTFKGRANGMRMDIAQTLADMKPAFFRLPGGNNLEGQTIDTRWIWNNTVGPLVDRPGRNGDWGYVNTDGLGLLEYLFWCEDLDMVPIMAVWDGYTLGMDVVGPDDLGSFIQEAIDQINFVIGDPSESPQAALRASLGHPDPFPLLHVEIGNEDFISSISTDTYQEYRWQAFFGNLSAAFPQLRFLATTQPFAPILNPSPEEYDVHTYNTPQWFATNSFFYDTMERNGTQFFHGEYAAISLNSSDIFGSVADGRLTFPTMQSAAGEAAFMTGFERNSDIVFAASYAPLLQNLADPSFTAWTPNLVNFDASTVYRSTGFLNQQLFSQNKGDEYLPSTLSNPNGPLLWSVTRRNSTNEILFKISNPTDNDEAISFQLPFDSIASTGTQTVLTGPPTASNAPGSPNAVVPTTSSIDVDTAGKFVNYTAPAWSVTVLNVVAS